MRILLTTESYLPYLSGVTVSVDTLARGLGALGHEVLVLAPRPARGAKVVDVGSPGPAPRHAWLGSYQTPRIAPPAYRMPWPNPVARAVREAIAFEPDVVHPHSPFVTGVLARRIARRVGAPLVFSHHTRFTDYVHYLGPLAWAAGRLTDAYLRRFWGTCRAVIAPSEDLAVEIRARMPALRVEAIPTGIDVRAMRELVPVDPRGHAGWDTDTVVAVSLGRLAAEKSPLTLLDAVALALRTDERLGLVLIGGGAAEAPLRKRAAQPDLAGRVLITGALPRPDALALMAGADLFAFASRTETQGLVLAEALAAGLPVVAVDGPGVRDSVRDGIDGRVVPADPAADRAARLADAILGLAADVAERGRLAERARADAERFDVRTRVAQVDALYRSLLA